jgi:DNA-binding response OmpR family regulator
MPRILVVDDQKDVRAMLCMVLRVNRFDVAEADSIKSGLRAFVEQDYDAVVVDIFLKDENGFDLMVAMRERAPNLPVVAVSGMTTLDSVARTSELSNVVCLQKPFRPVDLIRAIETARASVGQQGGAARMTG